MFDFQQITGAEDSKQANFSSLCSRLILALHPKAKPVEGKGGDEGLDTFLGDFNGKVNAFQHKYFLEKLGKAQKRQILVSVETADSHHEVEVWTLMLPRDLNPTEIKWFDTLRKKYPHIQMDWWGKTKLQALLADNPRIARDFQPSPNVIVYVVQKEVDMKKATDQELADALRNVAGLSSAVTSVEAIQNVLLAAARDLRRRTVLRILIFGPGPSYSEFHAKRLEIREKLERLGHVVHFGEDVCTPDLLLRTGLNLSVAELLQARNYDYIVSLMVSPGTIGEVHDFAGRREFATRMLICIDANHQSGYSAHGVLRRFEGHNGRIDWFKYPIDLTDCHLATRVLDQIQKVAENKHWEQAVGPVPL
jgi:hypothetical protein